jgi:hypothetical protein
MTEEKLHTEISTDNGFRGTAKRTIRIGETAKRTIRIEITADAAFKDEFEEIRTAIHEVLDDE